MGRPGGAPAAIFNPVLAILQRRLEDLEKVDVSVTQVRLAIQYLQARLPYYTGELDRETAINGLVDAAIGMKGVWGLKISWAGNIAPNAIWWSDEFPILILELKNSMGLGGDAFLQAVIVYSKLVTQEKVECPISAALRPMAYLCLQFKRFREFCNFPIILIGATANRLEISVAVCVGSIYVSKLLTLDLSLGFHASDNLIRLTRVFVALSDCRVDLQNYYDEVVKLRSPRLSCLFPSPTLIDVA